MCACFAFLAFMGISSGSGRVFGWFVNMYAVSVGPSEQLTHIARRSAVSGLSSWFGISVTYIRFHRGLKAQGIDRKTLPFMSSLQPFAAWYAAIGCFLVILVSTTLSCGRVVLTLTLPPPIYTRLCPPCPPSVQRLVCVPEGPLAHRYIRNQLSADGVVPIVLRRREAVDTCAARAVC